MEVDRFADVPLYLQVAAQLRERVRSGQITGRLPSAQDIAQDTGIAVLTARKALRVLRDEGWARLSVGQGTYAARPGGRQDEG